MNEPNWTFRFFVPGVPQPQPRVKFARAGAFTRAYTPKGEWAKWKRSIAIICARAPSVVPHDGPVELDITYAMPRPKGLPKRVKDGAYCWRKPDVDNMEKLVLDTLKNCRWFTDDGRVASVCHKKLYVSENHGVHIDITLLDEGASPS